jgi:hypothetical protein
LIAKPAFSSHCHLLTSLDFTGSKVLPIPSCSSCRLLLLGASNKQVVCVCSAARKSFGSRFDACSSHSSQIIIHHLDHRYRHPNIKYLLLH